MGGAISRVWTSGLAGHVFVPCQKRCDKPLSGAVHTFCLAEIPRSKQVLGHQAIGPKVIDQLLRGQSA